MKLKLLILSLTMILTSNMMMGQNDSISECNCFDDTMVVLGNPTPTFPGGEHKLFDFLSKNIKFPKQYDEHHINDRVIAKFCITNIGNITDIKILKGKDEYLNNEVIRVIKLMPKWEPPYFKGKPICSYYILPVTFKDEETIVDENGSKFKEDWVKQDSILIERLYSNLIDGPQSLIKFLNPQTDKYENLGYGYSSYESSIGKGYVSIFYKIVFKGGKCVAYELSPQMPTNLKLKTRYLNLFSKLFDIQNEIPSKLYYGYDNVCSIDGGDVDTTLSEDFKYFLTPFCGIMYGYSGGIANSIFENRNLFNHIYNTINGKELGFMLRSVNPATRLFGAEFYYLNEDKCKEKQPYEVLINKNFNELDEIQTMNGCFLETENAKKMVKEMVNIERKP